MSEQANHSSTQAARPSPVARAEHLLNRFGQQLQMTRMRAAARSATGGPNGKQAPPVERAEEMLDRAGSQLGGIAARTTQGMRRFLARAREEAEDWWVEAQQMRQNGQGHDTAGHEHEHPKQAH